MAAMADALGVAVLGAVMVGNLPHPVNDPWVIEWWTTSETVHVRVAVELHCSARYPEWVSSVPGDL